MPGVQATGFLGVKNDPWWMFTMTGKGRGRASTKPLRVDAGTHVVVCEQTGTGNKWTRTVDVEAGKTATASGSMLGTFAVTLGVDATIDGTPYPRGTVVNLKRGRHDLVIGTARSRFDLTGACTVGTSPEPGCY